MVDDIVGLLKKLDENGRTGLDLSPGDSVCAEAAACIRKQMRELKMYKAKFPNFYPEELEE